MRLVGATLVRNAADIIEAFVRHNLSIFDGLAILDHGSSDGTSEILAALSAERLPIFVGRNETASFDQQRLMNRLVRRIFKTSDADWVFPLDSDEFIKVRSRSRLEAVLHDVSASGHLVLPWLTYVPRFGEGCDTLTLLLSAKRVLEQRHGFAKVAVHRHFRLTKTQRLGKGNHTVERLGAGDGQSRSDALFCPPDAAAIAHVPIRSVPQFIAKFASGWLGALASGTIVGEESFHWRQAYAHLRSGKPVAAAQLAAFAANYGVPQERWLPVEDIALVDDPFLAPIELRHVPSGLQDPLPLILTVAERLLAQRSADLPVGAA
jgi:hypothetical protein